MSAKTDIEAAFDAAAAADAGTLALGDRAPVKCLLPDWIGFSADGDGGAIHQTGFSRAIVKRSDIGSKPKPAETGKLEWSGESYEMAVSSEGGDEIRTTPGTYEFTLSSLQ